MNSIAQIGKAALSRLFKSGTYYAKEIQFPREEFNLLNNVRWLRPENHDGLNQTVGEKYYIWGIELGLRSIETVEGKTFANAIAKFLDNRFNPSHIIHCT